MTRVASTGKTCVKNAVCGSGNGKCVPDNRKGKKGQYCTNNGQCKSSKGCNVFRSDRTGTCF